jgi:drug/metabolite transporter (DMT)-like permease
MTTAIELTGDRPTAKLRRPWEVALLSGSTFGIYWFVWYYKINREMRDFGASRGDEKLGASRPVRSLLALLASPLLFFMPLFSLIGTVRRMRRVERLAHGSAARSTTLLVLLVGGVLAKLVPQSADASTLIVSVCGMAACLTASALIQSRLNAVWRTCGARPSLEPTAAESRKPSALLPPEPVRPPAPEPGPGSTVPVSGGTQLPALLENDLDGSRAAA